jgi:hypothetical protein
VAGDIPPSSLTSRINTHGMKRELSKQDKLIKLAYDRGYYVDKLGVIYGLTVNVLKVRYDHRGYLRISIRDEHGKKRCLHVHRLQAYQKFGDAIFEEGILTRHMNDICTDNSWDNIEIGTYQDNANDKRLNRNKDYDSQ